MNTFLFLAGKKPMRFSLFVVLLVALFLQGCAGPVTTPTAAIPDAEETEASPTQPTLEPGGPSGILRVAMEPLVQTDPAFISSDAEVLVAGHVYDYLVDVTPENKISPRLATNWRNSPDGLTFVFQ